jgi:hypothetical protein
MGCGAPVGEGEGSISGVGLMEGNTEGDFDGEIDAVGEIRGGAVGDAVTDGTGVGSFGAPGSTSGASSGALFVASAAKGATEPGAAAGDPAIGSSPVTRITSKRVRSMTGWT